MTNDQMTEAQKTFFDYAYPMLSHRMDNLERENKDLWRSFQDNIIERTSLMVELKQYKKKIQRIEQMLIKHGLIRLLGKEK